MGPSADLADLITGVAQLQAADRGGVPDAQLLVDMEYVLTLGRMIESFQAAELRRLDARKVTDALCGRSTKS